MVALANPLLSFSFLSLLPLCSLSPTHNKPRITAFLSLEHCTRITNRLVVPSNVDFGGSSWRRPSTRHVYGTWASGSHDFKPPFLHCQWSFPGNLGAIQLSSPWSTRGFPPCRLNHRHWKMGHYSLLCFPQCFSANRSWFVTWFPPFLYTIRNFFAMICTYMDSEKH